MLRSRKIKSNTVLLRLNGEQRRAVLDYAESHSLEEVSRWVHEQFGVGNPKTLKPLSNDSVSRWLARHREKEPAALCEITSALRPAMELEDSLRPTMELADFIAAGLCSALALPKASRHPISQAAFYHLIEFPVGNRAVEADRLTIFAFSLLRMPRGEVTTKARSKASER